MRILLVVFFLLTTIFSLAQDDVAPAKKKKQPVDMSNRPNDHFMIQLGYTGWAGIPDTISKQGLSKSFFPV